MDWWEEKVVAPIEGAGYTVSTEFKSAMSGGMDPMVVFHNQIRGASRSAAKGVAEEIRGEIDYVFDQKLIPYTDRLDQIVFERIKQVQGVGEEIIKDAAAEFSDLLKQGRGHIEKVLTGTVDPLVKDNLLLAFDLLNHARAEAILALRGLLGEVDVLLERQITNIYIMVLELLAQLKTVVSEMIAELRKEVIEPTFEKLDKLETKFFQDVGAILDKLGEIQGDANGQIEFFRQRFFELLLPVGDNWHCYKQTKIKPVFGLALEDREVYRLYECKQLKEIGDQIDVIEVSRVQEIYSQMQGNLWLFSCKYRSSPEARGIYLKDWAKYGYLARVWGAHA